jgi:hypothetical protein
MGVAALFPAVSDDCFVEGTAPDSVLAALPMARMLG